MDEPNETTIDLTKSLRQSLEILQLAGVSSLPKVLVAPKAGLPSTPAQLEKRPESATSNASPVAVSPTTRSEVADPSPIKDQTNKAVSSAPTSRPVPAKKTAPISVQTSASRTVDRSANATKADLLEGLNEQVKACTLCAELAQKRTQTVFGVGNPDARLCFLGEAPGAEEDRLGEPFVGKAGQLQDKIIQACGMERKDVYILNILRCRPPGNRNPTPEEATNCKPFYQRQLEIVDPEFIVCLGAVAATNLLNTTLSVGRLRGTFHTFGRAKVMATYHPSYLLRNPAAKKYVWDDMKMLLQEMGMEIPTT